MGPHVTNKLIHPNEGFVASWTDLETLAFMLKKLSQDVELFVTPGAGTLQSQVSKTMHQEDMVPEISSVSTN